jgi:hypothetical protein
MEERKDDQEESEKRTSYTGLGIAIGAVLA